MQSESINKATPQMTVNFNRLKQQLVISGNFIYKYTVIIIIILNVNISTVLKVCPERYKRKLYKEELT